MRFVLFFISLLLSLTLPFSLLADDFIYDSPYGGKKVGESVLINIERLRFPDGEKEVQQ